MSIEELRDRVAWIDATKRANKLIHFAVAVWVIGCVVVFSVGAATPDLPVIDRVLLIGLGAMAAPLVVTLTSQTWDIQVSIRHRGKALREQLAQMEERIKAERDYGTWSIERARATAWWLKHLPNYRAQGYVYLIQDADVTSYCKIGRTSNPRRRFSDFGAKLPFDFYIIDLAPCRDSHKTEAALHRHFSDRRKRGEWFALDSKDIIQVRELMRQELHLWQAEVNA